MELGPLLKQARRLKGYSQDQVSTTAEISQVHISRLEREDYQVEAPASMRLGLLYGLTPNEIAYAAGWWAGGEDHDIKIEVKELKTQVRSLLEKLEERYPSS